MGKAHSHLEKARKEIDQLEQSLSSGGSTQPLKDKLVAMVRVARLQGDFVSADELLTKLLALYEQDQDKFNSAKTMMDLSTVMRQELEPVPSAPSIGETDRMAKFGKAEDLIVRAVEIFKSLDTAEAKLQIGKAHALLAVLQQSYGRTDEAQKSCDKALQAYAEFPLSCDAEKWHLKNNEWVSALFPNGVPRDKRGSQDSSRSSLPGHSVSGLPELLTATASLNAIVPPAQGEGANPAPLAKAEWRLVPYSVLQRRPSAIQRLRQKGQRGSMDEQMPVIDLVAPRVEVGSLANKPKPRPGTTYVSIKHKEISEKHAMFEYSTEDSTWIVADINAPRGQGVRVNGVRILRAALREGDLIQLGGAAKIKMGASSKSGDGISYLFERVPSGTEDDLSNLAAIFSAAPGAQPSELREDALKHFQLIAKAAAINLNHPPLSAAQVNDLFTKCIDNAVPFNLWDSFLVGELSASKKSN